MAHFESWQRLRIMVAVVNADKVLSDVKKITCFRLGEDFRG